MSVRPARCERSCSTSKLVSLAKRISPPGMSDCSGSHCFVVPFAETVLIAARRSAPPIASTARLTRLCSLVSGLAQDSRANVERKTSERFMGPPPEGRCRANSGSLPLFLPDKGLKIAAAALMPRKRNLMRADRLGYVVAGVALIVWAWPWPRRLRAGVRGLGSRLLYQAYTGSNPMFKPPGIHLNPQPAQAHLAQTLVGEEAVTIRRARA